MRTYWWRTYWWRLTYLHTPQVLFLCLFSVSQQKIYVTYPILIPLISIAPTFGLHLDRLIAFPTTLLQLFRFTQKRTPLYTLEQRQPAAITRIGLDYMTGCRIRILPLAPRA